MIESYDFGQVTVDGKTYTRDIIVYPDRVDTTWWREESHALSRADIWQAIEAQPEILVVGTGKWGRLHVLPETERLLAERGIQLVVEPTARACQSYNQLRQQGRRVIAALHLTC